MADKEEEIIKANLKELRAIRPSLFKQEDEDEDEDEEKSEGENEEGQGDEDDEEESQ